MNAEEKNKNGFGWGDAAPSRRTMLIASLSVLAVIVIILLTPSIRRNIQESQLESIVYNEIDSKKVQTFENLDIRKKVAGGQTFSVLFSKPQGANYQKVIDKLNDKKFQSSMNRNIYIYPLIYDTEEICSRYKLKENQQTFVFFEAGSEKNRFTYEELPKTGSDLSAVLNSLPMEGFSVKEMAEGTKESAPTEGTAESASTVTSSEAKGAAATDDSTAIE